MRSGGHLLDRTSPKGTPFAGRCRYCGTDDLPPAAARQDCPSAPKRQAVLDALESPRASR